MLGKRLPLRHSVTVVEGTDPADVYWVPIGLRQLALRSAKERPES